MRSYNVTIDLGEVELHWSVLIGAFEPTVEEAAMDLTQLEHHIGLHIFMNDQLGQTMPSRRMRVTQADLRVALLVQADRGHVEELDVLVEGHPEDAVQFVIHRDLASQLLHPERSHRVPFTMPLSLCSSSVGISEFDKSDHTAIVGVNDGPCMEQGVRMVVCQSIALNL